MHYYIFYTYIHVHICKYLNPPESNKFRLKDNNTLLKCVKMQRMCFFNLI